jgi:hypothetical protein
MRKFFVLTVLLVYISFFAASAQNYQVHSVYIYSYMKYIKWPDSSENESFKLGVWGDSEVTPFLEKLAETKKAGNRSIELIQVQDPAQVASLDMVFIAKQQFKELDWNRLVREASKESIALLTEEEGFPVGGHINFVLEDNKLFFQLDRPALEQAGLRISTELMALARTVE